MRHVAHGPNHSFYRQGLHVSQLKCKQGPQKPRSARAQRQRARCVTTGQTERQGYRKTTRTISGRAPSPRARNRPACLPSSSAPCPRASLSETPAKTTLPAGSSFNRLWPVPSGGSSSTSCARSRRCFARPSSAAAALHLRAHTHQRARARRPCGRRDAEARIRVAGAWQRHDYELWSSGEHALGAGAATQGRCSLDEMRAAPRASAYPESRRPRSGVFRRNSSECPSSRLEC